ncbi:MAG: GvpL/GvpF family gas vesicle protein [Planctomycetes bacterium]|nr:GvpL/GvpF family gas vesicle protein [Planctomycetota bacterium]
MGTKAFVDQRRVYVYGVAADWPARAMTSRGRRPEACLPGPFPVPGIGGRPVSLCRFKGLCAITSEAPTPTIRIDKAAVLRHEAILEAAMRVSDVVPARFGTTFSSPAALRRVLRQRHRQLQTLLRRIRGCLEYGVRLLIDAGPAAQGPEVDGRRYGPGDQARAAWPRAGGPGLSFLRRKLAAVRQGESLRKVGAEWVERVNGFLAPRAREEGARIQVGRQVLVSLSYLVERRLAGAFEETLRVLPRCFPEVLFVGSGPWPPYSFVGTSDLEEEPVGSPPDNAGGLLDLLRGAFGPGVRI